MVDDRQKHQIYDKTEVKIIYNNRKAVRQKYLSMINKNLATGVDSTINTMKIMQSSQELLTVPKLILKRWLSTNKYEISQNTTNKDTLLEINGSSKIIHHRQFTKDYIENRFSSLTSHNFNPISNVQWKIYRCQLNAQEESCCCSCNSDAMFEVMKSLYDCYKKKNCDNCNCILCGHLPREERKTGEMRKSIIAMKTGSTKKQKKINDKKTKAALAAMEGKSPAQKQKILKDLAMSGVPLPEGRTKSEKELIQNVKTQLGIPQEGKTPEEKEKLRKAEDTGVLVPLEGKTYKEKEKILKKQAELGIELPEGRTASEKSLIDKLKIKVLKPSKKRTTEKLKQAKAAGFLTPLDGKTAAQKENILKGLAMSGLPFPEVKTESENKLVQKIRTEIGLPPSPKTKSEKENYDRAMTLGIITPLEGKTKNEKEKILKAQHNEGIPLPVGRTASEKAMISEIETAPTSKLSDKIRKAQATGLMTPIEGKSSEQKEKIFKGLAMQGLPIPEIKTASEKKIADKVRQDIGLPPEPKTAADKKKYDKAMAAGLIVPLEGKSLSQKEKILRTQQALGIPLTEGRTPSEKALIAKVKDTHKIPFPSGISIPTEKLKRAKSAGLITPLEGKAPQQKEKILKGLATLGVPLPEGKTPSETKLLKKVRDDLGLPPEPKTVADKERYKKALAAGIITPLEGKSSAQKEHILKTQHEAGLPLTQGRTASEKSLIAKIKAIPITVLSDKLKKAKATGLLTPLEGKTPTQKEKILRGLALQGLPMPEGKTSSEKKIISKVRADVGLPPEPKNAYEKKKYDKALAAGLITPLEGKSSSQKEKVLRAQQAMGIPLTVGRTPSEKALVSKIKEAPVIFFPSGVSIPTQNLKKAKEAGLLTPLEGKSREAKEKILKGLATYGIPLPEGQTSSDKKLINKIRNDLGVPPVPKTISEIENYNKALAEGIITPLEGKSPSQKEKILKAQYDAGLHLPEARNPSEKALMEKIKAVPPKMGPKSISSGKLRKAKAAGLLTPLEGKTPTQKEKILRGLALQGLPMPEGKTSSEKKIISKVRADVGLPPEPKNVYEKKKYDKALAAGLITPLEGKSSSQKEKVLRAQQAMGIPLTVGRTPSEKALVSKIKETPIILFPSGVSIPTQNLKKAKEAGLLTPLEGKSREAKEKILKGLATYGIPLPEGQTSSDKKLINQIRNDLGVPPVPKTISEIANYNKALAEGIITPLEGKSPSQKEKILKAQYDAGLHLPEARNPSEKVLIDKIKAVPPKMGPKSIPSGKLRKAKAAGLLTPLEGKTPEQKEKILKGLALHGIVLPDGKTLSEKKLIDKVRKDVGLPAAPKSADDSKKYKKAVIAGIITPLEGKTSGQKEKILKAQYDFGLSLPVGRTPSEKALIDRIKATPRTPPTSLMRIPTEKLRKAAAAGLITPLKGKTQEQKEKIIKGLAKQGLPIPDGKTLSEIKVIDKVRAEIGLPPRPLTSDEKRKYDRALAAGFITPLEGKSPAEKQKILRLQKAMGIPLTKGRTPSEQTLVAKINSIPKRTFLSGISISAEKLKTAKAAGLLTPMDGKPLAQKEKILKGLATHGIPLPEGITPSEKKLIDKVRNDLGLPPEPKTASEKEKYKKALAAGIITPLEGKTTTQKENILKAQYDAGMPLPQGRNPSEKALIAKIKSKPSRAYRSSIPSEKLRNAKAAGLLTPLQGKTPEQKEKILRGLALQGLPMPEGKTPSDKKIISKVRADVGLPPEPKNAYEKKKYDKALAAGLITPLEGKSSSKKEKVLRAQQAMGIPLTVGRTPSEKALVSKIKETPIISFPSGVSIPTQNLKKAKEAGLLTPLEGKSREAKEKILKGLATYGIPLPEGQTSSDKKLINKIRNDLGVPPVPKTTSEIENYNKALAEGIITPLEGKSPSQKEKILKAQYDAGVHLPEARNPSEKALMDKIKAEPQKMAPKSIPSGKLRKAKAAGLLTPLEGKTPEQKEKIVRGLAAHGLPIPEGKTLSEKKLIDNVRVAIGLPPEPKTASERKQYSKALAAGFIVPLEGKSPTEKEKILQAQQTIGIPLTEGRTKSEKALIAKVRAKPNIIFPSGISIPTEKLRKAQADGLITPLEGKPPNKKEKILKNLAAHGVPLPKGKTASEKKLIEKVRKDLGLAPIPKSTSDKLKYNRALANGVITPLDGKTLSQKEKVLKAQHDAGLPLPIGRSQSERELIEKIKKLPRASSEEYLARSGVLLSKPTTRSEKEMLYKAKAEGLLTPLTGKTIEQKQKIIKGLADAGLPIPEGTTTSEKDLIKKIRTELGLPPSEKKGKIKTKSKKIGGEAEKKSSLKEEFEDIIKTTTCDRGCGCDKKKIKFKHSYVKIRVTSPDISSLCPCPDECLPKVKHGVFTDNEGIKVTVGSAVGVPSYLKTTHNDSDSLLYDYLINMLKIKEKGKIVRKIKSHENCRDKYNFNKGTCLRQDILETGNQTIKCNFLNTSNISSSSSLLSISTRRSISSLESNFIVRTESSVSLSSIVISESTISIISLIESSFTTNLYNVKSSEPSNTDNSCFIRELLYDDQFHKSFSAVVGMQPTNNNYNHENGKKYNKMVLFRESQRHFFPRNEYIFLSSSQSDTSIIIDDIHNAPSYLELINNLFTKRTHSDSCIVLMIHSSDENSSDSASNCTDSAICAQVTQNICKWEENDLHRKGAGIHIIRKSKTRDTALNSLAYKTQSTSHMNITKSCRRKTLKLQSKDMSLEYVALAPTKQYRAISVDTVSDRPCCCKPMKLISGNRIISYSHTNVASEIQKPRIAKQGIIQDSHQNSIRLSICHIPPCHRPLAQPVGTHDSLSGRLGCPDSPKNPNLSTSYAKHGVPAWCGSPPQNGKSQFMNSFQSRQNEVDGCTSCERPVDIDVTRDGRGMGAAKKKLEQLCPCEMYDSSQIIYGPAKSDNKSYKKNCRKCAEVKQKQAKKCKRAKCATDSRVLEQSNKKKCDCAAGSSEPDLNFDYSILIDMINENQKIEQQHNLKMKSDMTQTTSGFKFKVKKRPPEMTLEDAIQYFKEHPEEVPEPTLEQDDCICDDHSHKRSTMFSIFKWNENQCECPPDSPDKEMNERLFTEAEEPPLKGIKFFIEGKGSASKGLSGICCFDLLKEDIF